MQRIIRGQKSAQRLQEAIEQKRTRNLIENIVKDKIDDQIDPSNDIFEVTGLELHRAVEAGYNAGLNEARKKIRESDDKDDSKVKPEHKKRLPKEIENVKQDIEMFNSSLEIYQQNPGIFREHIQWNQAQIKDLEKALAGLIAYQDGKVDFENLCSEARKKLRDIPEWGRKGT